MSDSFHRFAAPTYTGAPAIPNPGPTTINFNGVNYNYINVIPGGTGAGGSAFADGAKGAGPNIGTLWVAFGEDATSTDVNRGFRALAENTDTLDDRFHTDLAVSILPPYVTAVGAVPTIVLLGPGVFVGDVVGYPLEMLFEVVDSLNREIFDAGTGAKIKVASIAGAVVGDGFSGGNVTLTLNYSIPNGQTYSVWYGQRSNLASLPVDALNFHRIRTANEVDAEVENTFRLMQGPSGQNISWNQSPPTTTLFDAAAGGLNERYNRATGVTVPIVPPESYWSTNVVTGTYSPNGTPTTLAAHGGGGWFVRTGPAVTGYTGNSGVYVDPMQAIFSAKLMDTTSFQAFNPGAAGGVGYLMYGARRAGTAYAGESRYAPGFASFMHLWPHDFIGSMSTTDPYTRIISGANAALSLHGAYNADSGEAIVAVLDANNYFRDGSSHTAVSPGYDLLEVIYVKSGVTYQRTFIIVGFGETGDTTNPAKVRVRNLDGTVPDFTGPFTSATIRWISSTFACGDGAGAFHNAAHTDTAPVLLDGLFYQVPVDISSGVGNNVGRTPVTFSAASTIYTSPAVQWGGFQKAAPYGPILPSTLNGDGGFTIGAAGTANFYGPVWFRGDTATFDTASHAVFNNNVDFNNNAGGNQVNFNAGLLVTMQGTTEIYSGATFAILHGATTDISSDVRFSWSGGTPNIYFGDNTGAVALTLYSDVTYHSSFTALAGAIIDFYNNPTFHSTANFNTVGYLVPSLHIYNGGIQFDGAFGAPAYNAIVPLSTIYPNNTAKACGSLVVNGAGGFSSIGGLNYDASFPGGDATLLQITFKTNVPVPYTLVFCQYDSGGFVVAPSLVGTKLTTGFQVRFRRVDTNVVVTNVSASVVPFDFIVM